MTFCCDFDSHAPKWTKKYHTCIKNTLKFKSFCFVFRKVSSARWGCIFAEYKYILTQKCFNNSVSSVMKTCNSLFIYWSSDCVHVTFKNMPLDSSFSYSYLLPSQVSPVTLSGSTEASGILRMIGVAFPGEREREEWEREQEEARKRDHRRIGKVSVVSRAATLQW